MVDEAVKHYTAKLKREEAVERRLRMQDWRNRMESGVPEVSRHLRRQGEASTRLLEGATTREEACEQIRQFWKEAWAPSEVSEAQAQLDLQEALLDPMLQHLRGKTLPAWEEDRVEFEPLGAVKGHDVDHVAVGGVVVVHHQPDMVEEAFE